MTESTYKKLKRLEELKRHYGLFFYRPYPKQQEFHELGAAKSERLLMAANKIGKTYSAGFESAFHATGLYPDWWKGRKFQRSNRGWVGSVTAELARDGAQRILLGPVGKWGTGCIPRDMVVEIKRSRGVPDAVESILVRHISGDVSQVVFKSYKDGREAWQAEDLEWVWFDEEPPMDIYIEGITRLNNTRGLAYLTFTPLLGMSRVVMRFIGEESSPDRSVTNMTIEDAQHYTDEQRAAIIAKYPPHEREARARGTPMLGSGRIFQIAEEMVAEPPLQEIPTYWKQIIGMDFGWDHPTAGVRLAYDADNDTIHVVSAYRQREATPVVHAAAVRAWGAWIPVAWPADALQHDKGSGDQLAELYRKQGLKMISEHARFSDDRGRGVEAGLMEMLERMQTGRWKVANTLGQWWEEFRIYHRKDGRILKENDDLMDASRYALMMLRYAVPAEHEPPPPDRYRMRSLRRRQSLSWMAS